MKNQIHKIIKIILLIVFVLCCHFSSIMEAHPLAEVDVAALDRGHLTYRKTDKPGWTDYEYNPHVPIELWLQLKPYFLPVDHPVKEKLDSLFHDNRVTLSPETFTEAGFSITRRNRPYSAVVTGHKKLKGFLVKVYLDSQIAIPEWQMWLNRINGIEVIRECMQKHGYTDFALPKKWIYPLPAEPSPPLSNAYHRKNFILVVEDMNIVTNKQNKRYYKQKMNRPLLTKLYTVITECQLTDCIAIVNIPFTRRGKIAFIDTELFFNGTPNFSRLRKHLSKKMQNHLDHLIAEDTAH